MATRGVVAAGHPETAAAGAATLRAGGNAVDAAVASVLASLVAETLLTGLGAGGYMLVALPGTEPRLLDFFVEAPGRGADPDAREELVPISVSFGDAVQVFNVGPASVGTYGTPAGRAAVSSTSASASRTAESPSSIRPAARHASARRASHCGSRTLEPVARPASSPERSSGSPSPTWPCFTRAQRPSTMACAAQYGRSCSVARERRRSTAARWPRP